MCFAKVENRVAERRKVAGTMKATFAKRKIKSGHSQKDMKMSLGVDPAA